ncbi:MAG TPA: LacI family DNA-binding transcriptional regulator [Terrimicrobiaceae bacterium]|nr:LacI family DNA-binding transcriptional regulator [Terrimicrobiaceae bacterium]
MDLRAGERVLQYLLAEVDRPDLKDGSRLPTNKELARRLQVSLGTVQAVMRQLALDGRIRALRGSGTFLVANRRSALQPLRIGISAPLESLHDSDGWMSRIGGGMFRLALKGQVVLVGMSNHGADSADIIGELTAKMPELDALIVLPYSGVSQDSLIKRYEDAGKPVVHIHPPSLTRTANFVSSDFFGISYELGQVWKKIGHRRLLHLTTVGEIDSMRFAVSYQQRYAGLISGLGMNFLNHGSIRNLSATNNQASVEAGYQAVTQYLSAGGEIPDAVHCSGDWLALGALQAFREAKISVPGQVSIIGGSGLDLSRTACPNLTRISHELERVGQEAIEMAIQRINLKGVSLPGLVVPATFIGGATTRPEENALMKIGASSFGRSFPESHAEESLAAKL